MTNLGLSLCLSFLVILSLGFSAVSPAASPAGNTYIYTKCSKRSFSIPTPQYQSNVNLLLDHFVTSAGNDYSFGKFNTGPPKDDGVVYGLYQCRGDLSSPKCEGCVTKAVNHLKTACPMSTGGQIQLEDGCFVKYDNTSFFAAQEKREKYKRCGPTLVGDNRSDVLNRRDDVLTSLVVGGKGSYFRRVKRGSIQGAAQCVQDLSVNECDDCLSTASKLLRRECVTSTRGEMYLEKCYIRYADDHVDAGKSNENMGDNDYDGYSSSNINGDSGGGGRKNNIGMLIGIIAAILAVVATVGGLVLKLTNYCNNNGTCYCCYCCN